MYQRVLYEQWHNIVPYIAFGATAFIFLLMCVRGLSLKRDRASQLSHIPLDD
jgi:hypothetical protein